MRVNKQSLNNEVSVALLSSEIKNVNIRTNNSNNNGQQSSSRKKKVYPFPCRKCGQRNHKTKDCRGCYKCGSMDHKRINCPQNNDGSSQDTLKQAFSAESESFQKRNFFVIDSGATDHMTHRRDWFSTFQEFVIPIRIRIGNGEEIDAYGKGTIEIENNLHNRWSPGTMHDVLYVPKLTQKLFSVKVVAKRGIDFEINNYGKNCIFLKNETVVATGSDLGNLYKVNLSVVLPNQCLITEKVDTLQLWHERLCHQNKRHVKSFLSNLGIKILNVNDFCDGCAYGKHHKLPFNDRLDRAKEVREIIHTDVCGPMEIESLG